MTNRLITLENVSVGTGDAARLFSTDLTIEPGITEISGRSGSGKSSLLMAAYALREPTTGVVTHYDEDGQTVLFSKGHHEVDDPEASVLTRGLRASTRAIRELARSIPHETTDARAIARIRSRQFGFMAQAPYLMDRLTVGQNITLPHQARGNEIDPEYYAKLTERLEIDGLLDRYPAEVSGGELQRATIVSALIHKPRVIFGDELTSAQDPGFRDEAFAIIGERVDEGASFVYISHDSEVKERGGIPTETDVPRHTINLEDRRVI